MSKFNQTNTNKTVNRSGHEAYKMSEKEHLVSSVLTTMFGEPKYYGSTDNDIVRLATDCAKRDPGFLYNLANYARNEANLRSVSHVLTCVIAREAHLYTRLAIDAVVRRADDITEIMSCYLSMYGKPFPNALKRGVADAMQRFDEYQLAKYNGGNKSLKFKDVLRITHPSPKNKEIETLFGKVLNDTLETPYTWEVELSTRGNTKEVWNELIASGKVGYMALLRNLRNIVKCGADVAPVLAKLSNPKEVKKSRQMPFRFYSAYVELKKAGMMTPDIHEALEKAITLSTGNMPMMKGRTLIAIDTSGSMTSRVTAKSNVTCGEIGVLLGALATRMCEDATVCYFNSAGWGWTSSNQKGYRIERYGKYDSILDICEKNSRMSGGTDLRLPLEWALNENAYKPFDRIIYLSDNECNVSRWGNGIKSCQGLIDQYRGLKNQNVWVHAIDLEGYGTQQFCGKNFNVVAGWNERVLEFISLAENGMGNLVQYIENYGKELRD